MNNRLSPRQRRFVEEYLVDLNATQAAIRAAYSPRTADVKGSQLLGKVRIADAIAESMAARSERTGVTADEVIEGLREVVRRCLQRSAVMVWDRSARRLVQATDEDGRNIWTFDSSGANRALELLGKHLGLFMERKELVERTESLDIVIKFGD